MFFSLFPTDPPIVSLRLGSTLSADDIKDGDDVYFECHVQSNPQWRKLYWLHDVNIAIDEKFNIDQMIILPLTTCVISPCHFHMFIIEMRKEIT